MLPVTIKFFNSLISLRKYTKNKFRINEHKSFNEKISDYQQLTLLMLNIFDINSSSNNAIKIRKKKLEFSWLTDYK